MKTASPFIKADPHSACVACDRPTNTALGVRGETQWVTAFLHVLGLPVPVAGRIVLANYQPEGMVVRVCSDCVAKTTFPPPAITSPGANIPCITQPGRN